MWRLLVLLGITLFAAEIAPAAAQTARAAGAPPTVQAARGQRLAKHPVVALTFDDLPVAGSLPQGQSRVQIASTLTAELKASHLKGVYGFVNAVNMEKNPDAQKALRIWVDAGMNIGNHTWSHPSLADSTVEAYEQEIARNEPVLAQYAGARDWRWFRYPFLAEGDTLEKRNAVRGWLREHGYRVAQVTLNFQDYEWNDAYGRCLAKSDEAAIAWLRRSYLESAAEYVKLEREEELIAFGHEIPNVMLLHGMAFTMLMLPELIEQLRKQGFRFELLAKVERDAAYAQNPGAVFKYGGSLTTQVMDTRHLPYAAFPPLPAEKLQSLCK
ncbi:MAG: polysaccharide deacetylase family protein [Terracidiphilus sp.]